MDFYAKWFDELSSSEVYEILKERQKIFVVEQSIVYVDADDVDYKSLHCFIMHDGVIEAYLRAFYDEKKSVKTVSIGRVLTRIHGKGWGRQLMEQSLAVILQKLPCSIIRMDAQKYATGFYEKYGFKVVSDEYLEEGIVHVDMEVPADEMINRLKR